MRRHFGSYIGSIGEHEFHEFPTLESLSDPTVENKLKELGFGYRSRYIPKTAKLLLSMNIDLLEYRQKSYEDCMQMLLQLSGVGQKVADCICLMAFDKLQVVPVDTHVWQIAKRDYRLDIKSKTVNPKVCKFINDFFIETFGELAGWAHTVLTR